MSLVPGSGRVIEFAKAHACGNDFLLVNESAVAGRDPADVARRLCARTTGVGADGVEFLARDGRGGGRIRLRNADGSEAEISGNGTRCAAAFLAREQGLVRGARVCLETDAGARDCWIEEAAGERFVIRTGMGRPSVAARSVRLKDGTEVSGAVVGMGNPHFVIFVEGPEFGDWQRTGQAICRHAEFPQGTNVEFVRRLEPGRIEIRIYERGVGPTSSSGTGTSASAAAAIALSGSAGELEVLAPGGAQQVRWRGGAEELWLTGPAELIAEGRAYLGEALP